MTEETKRFVCVDAMGNNNKYWEYTYNLLTQMCTVTYGRVGSTKNTDDPKPMTRGQLDKVVAGKVNGRGKIGTTSYKPPYREITVLDSAPTGPSGPVKQSVVLEAAKAQLAKHDSDLIHLVDRLVAANRHELVQISGGKMDIDLSTGIIQTAVGVVTKDTVTKARKHLDKMTNYVIKANFDSNTFIEELNSYLMLVPQKVGHARGWHRAFVTDQAGLQKQNSLLDQLEASADLATTRITAALAGPKISDPVAPALFTASLRIVSEADIIKMVEKKFKETMNDRHESRHLHPVRVYEVMLPEMKDAFNLHGGKLQNIWQLWHGTRMFNVLSILKNGLICPPSSGGTYNISGRMFGDGVYFSDQSTKSLNYAYGYWDGARRDHNCFMFMCDVAMGNYYVPTRSGGTRPSGHDSIYAQANKSGVMNNEMIVPRTSQVNLRYLIEFDKK